MDGGNQKVVHFHQAEFDALAEEAMDYALKQIAEHKALKASDVLRAIYQACVVVGHDMSVFTYKEFLEEVDAMNTQCLETARAGFDLAKTQMAEEGAD